MNKFLANLKAQAEDQPFVAIGIALASLTAVTQFGNAVANAHGRKSWAREIKRRERIAKK